MNTWPIKGPLLVAALLLGLFDHLLPWGRASFAAGFAVVLPIIGFRDYWKTGRFWITVVALALVQIPLVIAMRPLVERSGFPLMYIFGMVDCISVAGAISFVCWRNEKTA